MIKQQWCCLWWEYSWGSWLNGRSHDHQHLPYKLAAAVYLGVSNSHKVKWYWIIKRNCRRAIRLDSVNWGWKQSIHSLTFFGVPTLNFGGKSRQLKRNKLWLEELELLYLQRFYAGYFLDPASVVHMCAESSWNPFHKVSCSKERVISGAKGWAGCSVGRGRGWRWWISAGLTEVQGTAIWIVSSPALVVL